MNSIRTARRYDFDTEVVIPTRLGGIPTAQSVRPGEIFYGGGGRSSYFRYVPDNALLVRTHLRLFFWHVEKASALVGAKPKGAANVRRDTETPPARYLPWWLVPGLISAAPIAALAGETALAHGLLHPACAAFAVSATWVNCACFGPVVTQFMTSRREVWLTIDDGPDPEDTPRLLDLLDEAGARATFFVIGEKASRHRNLVDEIVRRGHGLGYHNAISSAGSFWAAGPWRARREMQDALADLGHPTSLIRARSGWQTSLCIARCDSSIW